MKLKLILFFLFGLLCFSPQTSEASHGMGGEITWRCQPNGQFVFQMKFYRDCNGINCPSGPLNMSVTNHPTVSSIQLTNTVNNDISPAGCSTCLGQGPGTVQECIFESAPVTLSGTPPAGGWIFDWNSCCRSPSITNLINPGSQSFQLRAVMYAYNGQNTNPCYDSSPRFSERPSTILCTGFPFEYNNIAFDPELDSLVYSWAPALDANTGGVTPLAYTPGYTPQSPLPSATQNPMNVGAVLDPQTGIVSYTSFTSGYFATVVQVDAYKCGQLVASIFREINVVLLGGAGCQLQGSGLTNLPPLVTAPFPDSTGQFTLFNDTVCAGDTVTFFMSATDPDWDPAVGGLQTVTMLGAGPQFVNFTDWPTTGCMNPPCAFTNPALPTSAPFGTGVNFEWITSCAHLDFSQGCFSTGSDYTFLIRAQDNFCDAPAVNFSTVTITVLAPEELDSTTIRCVDVLPNGDVNLTWTNPIDPYGSWLNYQIETSPTGGAPWTPLDSVLVQAQTTYTHVGANAQNNQIYYRMYVRSGCDSSLVSTYSNVASTILLDVVNPGNFTADLSWNPVHAPLISGSSSWYHIYQELPANSGNWLFVDSTQNTTFIDTLNNVCSDTVNYRIEILDSTGCVSTSSIDGEVWQNILVPDPPIIVCASVNLFGQITINWTAPIDTADSFD
ncbi:MAG: hypothetical protein KJO64_05620, partial [Bacteroidia bacterium]|nr:hypothetical protein [Bacteroidia bacterium]